MSDTDSYDSASNVPAVATHHTDEVLNDHRNQMETLPPPDDTPVMFDSQLPAERVPPRSRAGLEIPRYGKTTRAYSETAYDASELHPRLLLKSQRKLTRAKSELPAMLKQRTNDSIASELNAGAHYSSKRERRPSRTLMDLEADSHALRSSQETEEDVCFPMLREHVRINGIDFDEIEDFVNEEREEQMLARERAEQNAQDAFGRLNTGRASGSSVAAKPNRNTAKYTPKNILLKTTSALLRSKTREEARFRNDTRKPRLPSDSSSDDYVYEKRVDEDDSSENVKFGGTRINDGDLVLPHRFSFFHSDNEETVHAPDIPSLLLPGQTARELFRNGEATWWLDCTCPTDAEMKILAKAFGIHPLTAEDIRMQETREKVELFRSYYFVCFHTFEPDKESEDYLEPINVYIVVFRDGVLTFHFSPILHPANVRRRVRQLRDYVDVSADWLCYAMIDDITDGFAPVITAIEYEADAIEDSVLIATSINFSSMLRRIGESRRKVMTLMRLLSNKADVIKMFAKRCQEEGYAGPVSGASRVNLSGMLSGGPSNNASPTPSQHGISFGPGPGAPPNMMSHFQQHADRVQPRADIALYLGDIQDHVVTMFQNLSAYEKIFSRSHANYLAQLQVESFNSNLTVTKILGNVTLIGTLFLPLNVITGLFGMNVHVPGEGKDNWFYGILGCMVLVVVTLFVVVKIWLRKIENSVEKSEDSKKSIKSYSLKQRTKEAAKSIISFPNRYD